MIGRNSTNIQGNILDIYLNDSDIYRIPTIGKNLISIKYKI